MDIAGDIADQTTIEQGFVEAVDQNSDREALRRQFLQDAHDADIAKLKEQLQSEREKNTKLAQELSEHRDKTKRVLKASKTRLTQAIEHQNRILYAIGLVILVALCFNSQLGRELAVQLMKGALGTK